MDSLPASDGGLPLFDCSLVGCRESVAVPDLLTQSAAVLRAVVVRVCRNDACVEGMAGELPAETGVLQAWGFPATGPAFGRVQRVGEDRYRLSLAFLESSDLRDGDRYLVRATHTPSGTVLAQVDEALRYTITTPNGPGCPPVCYGGALTVRRSELPAMPGRDVPGDSFEIFPEVTPASALRGGGEPHRNPLRVQLGAALGSSAAFGWRYYNITGLTSTTVRAVEVSGPDGAPLDPSFSLAGPLRAGFDIAASGTMPTLTVTFRPTAPTRAQARVRVRFDHGYYDTVVDAASE